MKAVCNSWQPLSYHISKPKTHIYIDKLHNSLITMSIKLFLKSCRLSKCVLTWPLAQTSPEIVQTGSSTLPQESQSVSLSISTTDSLQIFSQMLSTLIWKKKNYNSLTYMHTGIRQILVRYHFSPEHCYVTISTLKITFNMFM